MMIIIANIYSLFIMSDVLIATVIPILQIRKHRQIVVKFSKLIYLVVRP